MSSFLEDQRRQFEQIEPQLEQMADWLEGWLTQLARDLRLVEPRVSARAKKPHSFVLKIMARARNGRPWQTPLEDATDKVGGRIDVVFLEDLGRVAERIQAATDVFEIIKIENKLVDELGDRKLGYSGIHLDVRPHNLPEGLAPGHAVCEIQLRTHAQAAWAMAGHDLTYKAPVTPSTPQLRQMNRLTALLELFDEEVRRAVIKMMGRDGYPVAIVIRALEQAWFQYVAADYNRSLTRDIVTALLEDLTAEQAHEYARNVAQFAEDRRADLAAAYEDAFVGNALKAQPESLLIFLELSQRPQRLQHRWADAGLDHHLLEDLAAIWGTPLATPR